MLELMKMEKRNGKYTDDDITTQEQIITSLNNFKALPQIPESAKTIEPQIIEKKSIVELSPSVQLLLNKIKSELDAIDDEKNTIANKMADIPDEINCIDDVQQIKSLRKKWVNKNDEYWYVKTHGEMPEVQSIEKPTNLPNDKMELNRMFLNTRTNLSKARKGLRDAKTEVKKQHYQKKIKIAENLIDEIETKLAVI